jgi:hypothetical protein
MLSLVQQQLPCIIILGPWTSTIIIPGPAVRLPLHTIMRTARHTLPELCNFLYTYDGID